jgi:hypothetical protein
MKPLQELFWRELNYERVAEPLSRRNWSGDAAASLAEDPQLFAAGGEDNRFHVIYNRLASDSLPFAAERPVVSRLLRDHQHALFVFSNRQQDRWHFLNVKYDESLDRRHLFRRITVGASERLHTACQRLAMLDLETIKTHDPLGIQSQHDKAFDVGAVTEQFYKDYAAVLDEMEASLVGLRDTESERVRRDYAQLVLGRLLFLHFLQRKGWLGVAGKTAATGGRLVPDYDYLQNHFQRVSRSDKPDGSAFFDQFLTGLFFDVLCVLRRQRTASITRTYGEIPFLNGGLFHRITHERNTSHIHIPNRVFARLFDGPDALFVRYNFTVRENDPLDVEVAVDPEMMGLVFERQVVEREVKGAFYTPPPHVDLMCQRAIAEYLCAETALERSLVTAFVETECADGLDDHQACLLLDVLWRVTVCDAAAGSGAFLMGMLHKLVRLLYALYGRSVSAAAELRQRLKQVAPSEVAVGAWTESRVKYLLKRAIIRNNLFGVDIEPSATQIAQLRMWLSLCVEHESEFVDDIPPLPNLDSNLRVGNSLVGSYLGIDFETETDARSDVFKEHLDDLERLEREYFEMTGEKEKADQLAEIDLRHWRLLQTGVEDEIRRLPGKREAIVKALEERKTLSLFPEFEKHTADELAEFERLDRREVELSKGLEHLVCEDPALRKEDRSRHPVLWKVHFARVFRDRGGFDIVVLNPPYVSMQGASRLDWAKEVIAKLGFNDDLYSFFTFRAFGLPERHFAGIARPGGVVCFITSDTYFTLQTKAAMRQLLQSKDLRMLIQCDPFRQTVDTAIFLALNRPAQPDQKLEFIQARAVLDHVPPVPFEPDWQDGAVVELPTLEAEDDDDSPRRKRKPRPTFTVREVFHDKLRRYLVPVDVYRQALKHAFFEPSRRNVALYNRFMEPMRRLTAEWWNHIETSAKFEKNRAALAQYHASLKPGDATLVGLVCEGGQGMRTANNGRFLGYLEGTPQTEAILKRRRKLERCWEEDPKVVPVFKRLKTKGLDFPELCDGLKEHFPGERKWRDVLGLQRGELYRIVQKAEVHDVSGLIEAERKRLIHEGIKGKRCWVPFRKGDPEGNKWVSFDPLYICWSAENVKWLFAHSGHSEDNMPVIRNAHVYFTTGITWTAVANHVPLKARLQPACVFDADSMRLTPIGALSPLAFLAVLNADLFSYMKWRFIKSTQKYEIGDLRLLPLVVPTPKQNRQLEALAQRAVAVQTDILQNGRDERRAELDAIQREVNEAVEDLYGVTGLGPFDEF